MNKQEVIMKLEEKDNNAYEKQQAYLTGSALFQRYEAQRIAYRTAINYVERIDEPQKDTTRKIPQIIAKYLELCKSDNFDFTEDYNLVSYDFINHFDTDLTIEEIEEIKMWFYDNDQKENERRHILFLQAYTDGYEVEEELKWVVNEGDLVIRKGEHEAKIYFVESIDDDGILLVNGIKDQFFTDLPERAVGDESVSYFYKNFRLLAKKENLEVEQVEV